MNALLNKKVFFGPKLARNATGIGAIFNHSICKLRSYGKKYFHRRQSPAIAGLPAKLNSAQLRK